MNCPVCKTTEMVVNELEPELRSMKCVTCSGNFIRGVEYWEWLSIHGPNLPEKEVDTDGLDRNETLDQLDCPECRWRMVKYLAGRGTGFALDHCRGCKGLWLDKNEWETLKARNLHDDLHAMLTPFWQAEAQREARRHRAEERLIARFGKDDYLKMKEFREWMFAHERKHEILAYLTSKDPLEI